MNSTIYTQNAGPSLRQAALIAGFGYLLTPTALAEFYIYPHLVIPGNIELTAQNILAHQYLFAAGFLAYLISFVMDIVIAWALYHLLRPVSASLSLLAAWFQLVYTAVGVTASLNLVTALQLLNDPAKTALFGLGPLHAQVLVLLMSFRTTWGLSLILFAAHLMLVGYLIIRSTFIPRLIGILLVINGVGYIVQNLNAYLFPGPDMSYVLVALLGELVFMFWLLLRGWKIREPMSARHPPLSPL